MEEFAREMVEIDVPEGGTSIQVVVLRAGGQPVAFSYYYATKSDGSEEPYSPFLQALEAETGDVGLVGMG